MNSAPIFNSPSTFTIDAPYIIDGNHSIPFATVSATDPDGDEFAFQLLTSNSDSQFFSFSRPTNELTYLQGNSLTQPKSADGDNVFNLQVWVEDEFTNYAIQNIAVTVTPLIHTAVTVSGAHVSEADGLAHITVTRVEGTSPFDSLAPFTVTYALADGTAKEGQDYLSVNGTLNFAQGQHTADLAIPIINDTVGELTQSFFVNFVSASPIYVFNTQAKVVIDDNDSAILGTGNADSMQGSTGDDFLRGLAGDDTLNGGSGDDPLFGGGGNDHLAGEEGNDILHGDLGNDVLDGGAGNDQLYGEADNDSAHGGDGQDAIYGQDGNDSLYGDGGADTLGGGAGEDLLFGGADDDQLTGDGGSDTLHGGDGNDNMIGSTGDDLLFGEAGDDVLYGNVGNDNLLGGNGNDRLNGGDGADFLDGGNGADYLDGGADADTFYFDAPDVGIDRIRGFVSGVDSIAVSATGFGLAPGALPASAFEVASVATGADAEFYYNSRIYTLYFDIDGAGGAPGTPLMVFIEKAVPTAADIIIV